MIESLPYPDSSFDAVTSSLMMHHLPQDVQLKSIAELYRVLKPGGRLLIADMMNPNVSTSRRIFTSLAMHHALRSGVEDLMKPLEDAGFVEVQQLDDRFLTIGFIRATKPVTSIHNKE